MRKHRLRCFFLSFIFIFFRRNSIRYGVNIVFRLCFCDSKNTIYFIDIQVFTYNTTKEKTPWLSSWQHHDSFEGICILSPWIPQNKQGKLQAQTWRHTHACHIGGRSASVLPGLTYFNLANVTWNACRRKGYSRMDYLQKLRFAVCFKA